MAQISSRLSDSGMLSQLRDMQTQMRQMSKSAENESPDDGNSARISFVDMLKENATEVNAMQKTADKMAVDLATGKSQDIHETMLASTKAELSFNMLVQVRNKILEAYQEVMRMQV